ncbi:MAG: class I SAM-dependent methyltransferase family protein [Candidatus Nealsonbacteria bacterium]|nr:class I SAM-dependent methyltransferase family protein [Candidatus Nealsonbacteria bacterium]
MKIIKQATTIPACAPSYERKRGGLAGWVKNLAVKLMRLLPTKAAQTVFLAFSGRDGDTVTVFKNVTTWRALEVMYTYPQRKARGETNLNSRFWEAFLDNARSIRNRLILVKTELHRVILETADKKELIRVLSIGSGSARSVLETIATFNGSSRQIKALLIDMDASAVDFSKELARQLNINGCATRITGNFFRLERDAAEFEPDIVELVGLLDYLTDRQVVVLLGKVRRILAPGGHLITGNILPNPEAPFVTKGVNWPMIYRRPEELEKLLVEAGFPAHSIKTHQEPLGVHMVAIAQKLLDP